MSSRGSGRKPLIISAHGSATLVGDTARMSAMLVSEQLRLRPLLCVGTCKSMPARATRRTGRGAPTRNIFHWVRRRRPIECNESSSLPGRTKQKAMARHTESIDATIVAHATESRASSS